LAFGFKEPQMETGLEGGSVDRPVSANRLYYGGMPDKYIGKRQNKEEINAQEMKHARRKETLIQHF
jgi:hypothetical protein